MISLAYRDALHNWGKFAFTGVGLGLLIGVTLVMAGVYRGMVDDARVILESSGADLWVVQQGTLGPYAEPSSIHDDIYRSILIIPGVQQAGNTTYLTMQVQKGTNDVRAMVVGVAPSRLGIGVGWPNYLVAGRRIVRSHYEAIADIGSGFELGERFRIRRNEYTVVGMTRRMVSSNGDPMIFIPLKDAQDIQFLRDNDTIWQERRRLGTHSFITNMLISGLEDEADNMLNSSTTVNTVLVTLKPYADADEVAESIRRWLRLTVYTREEMEAILVGKLVATAARQIGLFLIILTVVSAAIVGFIIYTLTMDKIREIAVLKLIGTKNRVITSMILQQAIALGIIGFIVGKIASTFSAPYFPKYVLMIPEDSVRGLIVVMIICVLASLVAIYAALKVSPEQAIGG